MTHVFEVETKIGPLHLSVEDTDRVRGWMPEAYTIHRILYAVQVDFVQRYDEWIMRDESRRIDTNARHNWTPHDPITWNGQIVRLIDVKTTDKAYQHLKNSLLPAFEMWLGLRSAEYRKGLREVYHATIQRYMADAQEMNGEVTKAWNFLHLVGEKVDQGEDLTPRELSQWKNLNKIYKFVYEWQRTIKL